MPQIRRKTFAAREDLIERASAVAKEKGFSFYAFLNEILQLTLQAEEMGVSLRSLIEERGLLKAAKEARKYGIPICPHCEETRLRGRREAKVRAYYNSEAAYIDRDIHVARDTYCSFHFPHVSLAKSTEYIAKAKKEGLPITADATPHHINGDGERA